MTLPPISFLTDTVASDAAHDRPATPDEEAATARESRQAALAALRELARS